MHKTLVFLLFGILTVILTMPLAFRLDNLVVNKQDALLNVWIINWTVHFFKTFPSNNYFNANIFYPYTNTFAYSDYQMLLGMVALPFSFLTSEPLAISNLVLLTGFVLTGMSAYMLLKYLTKNDSLGIFYGILITFSVFHFQYLAHQQSFHIWPVVFVVYFLFKRKFKSFAVATILASINTPLNFYFVLLISTIFWIYVKNVRYFLFKGILLSGVIVSLIFIPYWLVSFQFDYKRPITDAINFSLYLPDLFTISPLSRLSIFFNSAEKSSAFNFGFVFSVIFFMAIINLFRTKKFVDANSKLSFLLVITSLIFSLGPALHVVRETVHVWFLKAIPLPYAIFYYFLPGFAGMRSPTRWLILFFIFGSLFAVLQLRKYFTRVVIVSLSLLIILEINLPIKYESVKSKKNFSPEQIWLAENRIRDPVFFYPVYGWWNYMDVSLETERIYYSAVHWHPMFNGYSGFSPKRWEENVKWLQNDFPSSDTIRYLKNIGLKLIIIPNSITNFNYGLKLVKKFEEVSIYEI